MTLVRVRVDLGARGYDVVIGDGAAGVLSSVLSGRRRAAIVSQPAVDDHWGGGVRAALDAAGVAHDTFLVGDGEDHKSFATVEDLARGFARSGLLRGDAVVALGGGLVGDVAGFTASTYHRGIPVVHVPTTLLAMVDASIGGKTGVNLPEGKNLVGSFHQPLAVLADTRILETLPEREFRCGLGEVAKYALLGDTGLVDLLREKTGGLLDRDPGVLGAVVVRCAEGKARIVEADEEERTGIRARLNYGHTLAHAIETAAAYALAHGEAVAVGLMFAVNLAAALERVGPDEVDRHHGMLSALGLPVEAPPGLRAADLLSIMTRDKKAAGGLTFILPGPGGFERVDDPDPAAVLKALAAVGVPT